MNSIQYVAGSNSHSVGVKEKVSVSVVIATLGNDLLMDTIRSLNASTYSPREILICIPDYFKENVNHIDINNVRKVFTNCKGQVAQRAEGFKLVKGDFVLQLDDDCLVEPTLIEELVNTLNILPQQSAVGPLMLDVNTGESFYKRTKIEWKKKLFSYLINGSLSVKPGTVTKAGVNLGVTKEDIVHNSVEVEWLPGGCILHRKQFLFTNNYYPFSGKAYSEDLIHSFHLKANGIKLYITANCFCKTELNPESGNLLRILKENYRQYKSRKYFLTLSQKAGLRVHLFFFFTTGYNILKFMLNLIKGRYSEFE